jgi:hypothetical protein
VIRACNPDRLIMAHDYHANPPLSGGISWTKSDIQRCWPLGHC